MTTAHGYTTIVRDIESERTLEASTISLDALADQELAASIREGSRYPALDLFSKITDSPFTAFELPDVEGEREVTPQQLASIFSHDFDQAEQAWMEPRAADSEIAFAEQLLDAMVLAEHSDAHAMKPAKHIGVALAGSGTTILTTAMLSGIVTTGTVVAFSSVGIVVVAVGAPYLLYRLLTKSHSH